METIYEDISRAMDVSNNHYTILVGDFNTRLGRRSGANLVFWSMEPPKTAIARLHGERGTLHDELLLPIERAHEMDLDKSRW